MNIDTPRIAPEEINTERRTSNSESERERKRQRQTD